MKLLCFAHKNEAKAFIKDLGFKICDTHIDLYSNDSEYLLITGEGNQETTQNLSICLSNISEISEILNFGTAASLSSDIPKYAVRSIRTVYQFHDEYTFKSSTSNDHFAKTDNVSVLKRIGTSEVKKNLSIYAKILDKELWAIGAVAKKFKIPWKSYKVVSDELNEDLNCNIIKEQAEIYSNLLLKEYQSLDHNKKEIIEKEKINFSDFHFSFTQKKKFNKLFEILIKRDARFFLDLKQSSFFKNLIQKDITPKEKAKILITHLEKKFDPKLYEKQAEINEKFPKRGSDIFSINTNRLIEHQELLFHGVIKKNSDIPEIIKELNSINIDEL